MHRSDLDWEGGVGDTFWAEGTVKVPSAGFPLWSMEGCERYRQARRRPL